jgi:transposase
MIIFALSFLNHWLSMQNKYMYHSKISSRKFREILKYFCLEIDAEKTAILVNLNLNTAHRIFGKIRERIAEICEAESPFENGEIELDESYFGARRVRGIRGVEQKEKHLFLEC